MTKMTSAYANKVLRKLQEDKEFWLNKEREGMTYVAALDEEPVIPDYDYATVAAKLVEIDERIVRIKHAINVSNTTNLVDADGEQMTVDALLVRMAQLNRRKVTLNQMRRQPSQMRIGSGTYGGKKTAPEYQYINYDLELIQKEYEQIDARISAMQLALDRYNQVVEFEVED